MVPLLVEQVPELSTIANAATENAVPFQLPIHKHGQFCWSERSVARGTVEEQNSTVVAGTLPLLHLARPIIMFYFVLHAYYYFLFFFNNKGH